MTMGVQLLPGGTWMREIIDECEYLSICLASGLVSGHDFCDGYDDDGGDEEFGGGWNGVIFEFHGQPFGMDERGNKNKKRRRQAVLPAWWRLISELQSGRIRSLQV